MWDGALSEQERPQSEGGQHAVRTGPAVEAEAMGSALSLHLFFVLCRVERAAGSPEHT